MAVINLKAESDDNEYFAAKAPEEVAAVINNKVGAWCTSLEANGYLEKLRSMYCSYHGAYYRDVGTGHQVVFGGEQGELVNLPVNQFRNIATNILVMVTSNRPSLSCRSTNTDVKSQRQTILADDILDYYMREKKLEVYLKKAAEYAIVYGAGFVVMQWNSTTGELIDFDEETDTQIFEGDIEFENLSPFDVIYDNTKENNKHDWVVIRRWKNKYDLAAKYPEFADKIKALQTKSDLLKFRLGMTALLDYTDDVEVIEFFHKRTDCMPDGRYMMFLSADIVLEDTAMPYRVLPVFRIAAGDIHGSPYGYTPMFDLLPLQEQLNALYSTVATNQNAFGVQNVLNPRGTDIQVNQMAGGLNVIDYNAQAGKPEPLNLTATPKEIFEFIEIMEKCMETLSGVNSVARGNPEASLKSGTALALVQSMALQFQSGLQQSYVELCEDIGSAIIKMLQDFAYTPRIISIVGKSNRSYVKEFDAEDINTISRVIVDIGNPLAKTTAGRVQMAEQLIQYNDITPAQYINVIETGNLESVTEDTLNESLLMRAENEAILDGEIPNAVFTENHKEHIDYHRAVLFDPDLKKDPNLVNRVQAHIQQHIQLLRTTDPDLLMIMGQQPLQPPAPPQGPPGPPMPPPGKQPPHGNVHKGRTPQVMQAPPQGNVGQGVQGNTISGPGIPRAQPLPNIPTVKGNLLANPQMQQMGIGNVK